MFLQKKALLQYMHLFEVGLRFGFAIARAPTVRLNGPMNAPRFLAKIFYSSLPGMLLAAGLLPVRGQLQGLEDLATLSPAPGRRTRYGSRTRSALGSILPNRWWWRT